MNTYNNITTAAMTLLGCAAASSYQFVNSLVPIYSMRGAQFKDMLVGLVYSEMEMVVPPQGVIRDVLEAELYFFAATGPLKKIRPTPFFERQNKLIEDCRKDSSGLVARNEALIRSAFSGKKPQLDTMLDVVNVQFTFDNFHTVQSYDLNKISRDRIMHRPGYIHEYFEYQGEQISLHNIPVLSDGKKVFGSQFYDFNHAVVDEGTREILTVVFGFGLTMDHFNCFIDNVILLKNAQEEHAKTKTIRTQILSGYPIFYDLDCQQNPHIICQKV